jgi:DNA-binding NarL/FixJ family response regulator
MRMKRLLIIDDFFGRELGRGRNPDRESLCRRLGLAEYQDKQKRSVNRVTGNLRFFRGQTPEMAKVGDTVENDLKGCLHLIKAGAPDGEAWDMLILDLCFYTGQVTEASNAEFPGFPEGRPGDDDPEGFFGLSILSATREQHPSLPVVVFSAYSGKNIQSKVRDLGAVAFISRDDTNAGLTLSKAIARLNKREIPSGPRDCRALLELARSLPLPTIAELSNLLPVLKELETVLLRRALHGSLVRLSGKRISLLPALKLISGEADLTTSRAADIVKRLVRQTRPYESLLLSDALIKEAYTRSMRLRPGAARRSADD